MNIYELKDKIIGGYEISREEAAELLSADTEELCACADEIRRRMRGDTFDMCAIINGKSGRCSENCKYCAQSARYNADTDEYPLLPAEEIVRGAVDNYRRGVLRYSIVCSGKRLSDAEVEKMCEAIRAIKNACGISVCVSFGLLDEKAFRALKEAGADRAHNNLETSRRNFPNVCTTHTYDDKLKAVKAAKAAGLEVCSGGIFGLGETMEDRIDMAFAARELEISSVPINMLNPIPNTPYANNKILTNEEMARSAAIFRFILPGAFIRLAGGRGLLEDKGEKCFRSGANAAITGDMLTTAGISVETDMELMNRLGYKVEFAND